MKTLLLSFLFLQIATPLKSFALPVLNENVANSGVLTIYPDHKNPNQFYIAPNVAMIAKNSNGVPIFSYYDTRKSLFKPIGIMQMTLVPAYTLDDLNQAKAAILAKNPNAIFSGVPFIKSELALTGELKSIISDNQCQHLAGLIGQEQACVLELNNNGRYVFAKSIQNKLLFTTLQFNYSIQAVTSKADGSYADMDAVFGIAVRIDGDQLSQYPQLMQFLDI
jgi:hypothetical protein